MNTCFRPCQQYFFTQGNAFVIFHFPTNNFTLTERPTVLCFCSSLLVYYSGCSWATEHREGLKGFLATKHYIIIPDLSLRIGPSVNYFALRPNIMYLLIIQNAFIYIIIKQLHNTSFTVHTRFCHLQNVLPALQYHSLSFIQRSQFNATKVPFTKSGILRPHQNRISVCFYIHFHN